MSVVFYLVAALTIAGGLAAVLLKNLVHAALAVTVAFRGLALLFLSLDAQFAGFAQILVYIGAVAILIVFAILLTKAPTCPKTESSATPGSSDSQSPPQSSLSSDGPFFKARQYCRINPPFPLSQSTTLALHS